MTNLDQRILDQLIPYFLQYRQEIQECDPASQPPFKHLIAEWADGLRNCQEASVALVDCIEFLGTEGKCDETDMKIDRLTLFSSVQKNIAPSSRFLLQMIWGHVNNKRGIEKVLQYYRNPGIKDPDSYAVIVGMIHKKQYRDAFAKLTFLKNFGTSYATKVLYFESRDKDPEGYCVILDNKVSAQLIELTSPFAGCVDVLRPNDWNKYATYLDRLRLLAKGLDTHPENIELFLFKQSQRYDKSVSLEEALGEQA